MVNFCAVVGCSNKGKRDKKSFFRLPAVKFREGKAVEELTKRRRNVWLGNIKRSDIKSSNYANIRICSDHFITGKPAYLHDETNPDWAPTQNMGYPQNSRNATDMSRYERATNLSKKRKEKEEHEQSQLAEKNTYEAALALLMLDDSEEYSEDGHKRSIKIQTDLKASDISLMETELQRLQTENTNLENSLETYKFSPETLKDDSKVKFLTGLPNFLVLMTVFEYLGLTQHANPCLTSFQRYMLTLMRLRLNIPIQLLAYIFGVSKSTVSREFLRIIKCMHDKLTPFIYWPERVHIQETTPLVFREHFKTKIAVIIDCFEIFIERPSNLLARAQTWSNYKHSNTVKLLIGITPQGVISYLSKPWGGRVSDKYLTENCGILSNLLPGDVVLADRGFNIEESVGLMCAEVIIPAFTKGKRQLSAVEVEKTRKIANVRIHVERVIGVVRQKYTMLEGKIPIDYLMVKEDGATILEYITTVCCALVNFCESVVPFE